MLAMNLPFSHSLLVALVGVLLLGSTCVLSFTVHESDPSEVPTSHTYEQYITAHPPNEIPTGASPNAQRYTVLHINDLYELISSGSTGGVARLKTLRDNLHEMNPGRTLTVLAGDLFSPSALSTVAIKQLKGESFDGAQMVAAMNALPLDYATIGNHETDVSQTAFSRRLAESKFPWLCINTVNRDYPQIINSIVHNFTDSKTGEVTARFGIFGMTLDSNNRTYESYYPFDTSLDMAASEVSKLTATSDFVIGLTHLPYWHDQALVNTVPHIDIIMGGHEHTRIAITGMGTTPIYKADSNVDSAWIHDIWLDLSLNATDPKRVVIESTLVDIDHSLALESTMSTAIDSYVKLAFEGFEDAGFQPGATLATLTEDLIGTNEVIFSQPTILTELLNLACHEECHKYATETHPLPPIDAALFNAGAIRIDDTLPAGMTITQYDAIRISPYLNAVLVCNMTGALLKKTLTISDAYKSNSQHLQSYPNITTGDAGEYLVNGKPLIDSSDHWYTVGFLKYLLKGKAPYEFLQPSVNNTDIFVIAGDLNSDPPTADVRKSLIHQIALRYDPSTGDDDGPSSSKIMGLKTGVFVIVLILIILAVGMIGVVGYRRYKKHQVQRAERIDTDQRAFLATQYSLQQDGDIYHDA